MRGRHGFTVIELLIGLAVGGVVLILAGAVMGQLAADAGRVVRVRDALDRRAEARAFLTSAFRSLQVGQGMMTTFLDRRRQPSSRRAWRPLVAGSNRAASC